MKAVFALAVFASILVPAQPAATVELAPAVTLTAPRCATEGDHVCGVGGAFYQDGEPVNCDWTPEEDPCNGVDDGRRVEQGTCLAQSPGNYACSGAEPQEFTPPTPTEACSDEATTLEFGHGSYDYCLEAYADELHPGPPRKLTVFEDGGGELLYVKGTDWHARTFPADTFIWDCSTMGNRICGPTLPRTL